MAFVGVLCGGDDWKGIAAIAEELDSSPTRATTATTTRQTFARTT